MSDVQLFSDGKAYERLMGRWSRLAGDQFVDWLGLPQQLDWVDVGCGNGAFTQTVIERCAPRSLTGIDPAPGQIDYAKTRAGTSMANFKVGDAQQLPYDDASFDAAIMALVISFVPAPAKAVAEMRRVLRPGGLAAAYMWDFFDSGVPVNPIYVALKQMGIERPLPPSPEASRKEGMVALWEQAGLKSVETTELRITVRFESFDDFWESNSAPVGPQGVLIKAMNADQREQLKALLRDALPIAEDGTISYGAFANAVKGRVPH
jgi:ubiquinone/menaquinone biosynthesis C-methylase UbiE